MKTENKKQKNLIDVVEFCKQNSLPGRVVGRWVWIEFESIPDENTRQMLKDFGFKWSPRRQQWAHNCGHRSRAAKSYRPWDKYPTRSLDEVAEKLAS